LHKKEYFQKNYSDESIKILKLVYEKKESENENPNIAPVISEKVVPNLEAIKKLIEAGFDPNFKVKLHPRQEPSVKGPMIERAIMRNEVEVVEFLLSHGANPNLSSSILHAALISKENIGGERNYHTITSYPNRKILKILLEAKADPNAENYHHASPLRVAMNLQATVENHFRGLNNVGIEVEEQVLPDIDLLLLHGADSSIFRHGYPSHHGYDSCKHMNALRPCNDLFQKLRLFSHSANDTSTS